MGGPCVGSAFGPYNDADVSPSSRRDASPPKGEEMALLIGYDLNRPGQDYGSLHDAIKALGSWWHHLDSTWIVDTHKTCTQVRDELSKHIDANDELLVVKLTGEGAWRGFTPKGSEWLKKHL